MSSPLWTKRPLLCWIYDNKRGNVTLHNKISRTSQMLTFKACVIFSTYPSYVVSSYLSLTHWGRSRRNEQHFADDIFKRIFFNENVWISIEISLEFVPKGPINGIPALVQTMAWRRSGDKPLSEPMMVSLPTHICVTRPQWVKPILRRSIVSDEYDNVRSIRRVPSVCKVHYNNGESGM